MSYQRGSVQSANVPLLLIEFAFPTRCFAGAVVKMEAEETTTPSFAFSLHFSSRSSPGPDCRLWQAGAAVAVRLLARR